MTLRTRNRGRTGLKDTALARFGFFAHLRTHVMLAKGYGGASFTRATVATVKDFEGGIRNCLSGEVRFEGQRRVRNWFSYTEDWANAYWPLANAGTGSLPTKTANYAVAPDGSTTAGRLQCALNGGTTSTDISWMIGTLSTAPGVTDTGVMSWYLKTNDGTTKQVLLRLGITQAAVTVDGTWRRFSLTGTTTAANFQVGLRGAQGSSDSVDLLVWHPQFEVVTGQSNQNPSEYVSVGAAKLNEILQSDDMSNASWTRGNLTAAAQPDRVTRLTLTGGAVSHSIVQSGAAGRVPDNAYVVMTGKFKGDGVMNTLAMELFKKGTGPYPHRFNPNNGAPGATGVDGYLHTDLGGGWYQITCWVAVGTGGNETNRWYCYLGSYGSYSGDGQYVDVKEFQVYYTMTAPTAQPSYFPVGNVYPYHSACVDGVKYFDTENPNVVIDNIAYDTSEQPYTSTKWLRLPGASGAYASSPDSTSSSITGNIDLRVKVALADWTPTGHQSMIGKWTAAPNLSYQFYIALTTGAPTLSVSPNGTTIYTRACDAIPTVSDGDTLWLRVTRNYASGYVNFFTSTDTTDDPNAVSWTRLGSADLTTTASAIADTSAPIEIGIQNGTSSPQTGRVFRAAAYASIGGTVPAWDFNPSDSTVGGNAVFTSSTTGETWTVYGTAAIRITPPGRLPRQLDGYAAAYKVQENSVSNTFSTLGTYQPRGDMAFWAEVALDSWMPSATNGIGRQWNEGSGRVWNLLIATDGKITVHASTDGNLPGAISSTNATGFVAGSKHFVGFTRVAATGLVSIYTSEDGVTWDLAGTGNSTAGNLWTNNSDFIRIGVSGAGGDFCMGGKIFRAKMFAQANFTSTPVLDFNPREGWTENLLLQSGWSGATSGSPGSAPTSWSVGFGAGTSTTVTNRGDYNSVRFDADNTERVYFSQSINMVAGTRYTVSASLDAVGGSPGIGDMIFLVLGTATGSTVQTVTSPSTTGIKDLIFDCTGSGTCEVRIGIGCSSALGGTVFAEISRPRVRRLSIAGQRTTSGYLPTTTAALRGWISSTGEQWTMNGSATVLQRQADGYLSEPSTTNLVLQSSNFGTTWTASGSIGRSAAAAYCGDIALDLLSDADGAAASAYSQTPTYTGDAVKSCSLLIKQGTSTSSVVRLRDNTAGSDRILVAIAWSGGIPVLTFTNGSQERQPEAMGNGVFRIFCLSSSVTAANTHTLSIYPATDAALSVGNTGNVYCGGVQSENATVASSLQPTTTGTAGRNADFLYYQDSGNLSASQGSSYIEAGPLVGSGSTQVMLGHGDLSGRMVYNAGTPAVMTTYDGVNSVSSTSTRAPSQMAKVATVWGASSLKISTEAGVGTTSFDGSMGIAGNISVGSAPAGNQMEGLTKNVRIAQVIESSTDMIAVSK